MDVKSNVNEVVSDALKDLGVSSGVAVGLVTELVELSMEDEFLCDPKWQARVKKAIRPLNVDERVKSQLYTAARKELDTKAMNHYRRTGNILPVTEEDIEEAFNKKWEEYLLKKNEQRAKKKALRSTN